MLKTVVLSLFTVAGQLALALPQPRLNAHILKRQDEVKEEYDYVIVGGGTAGLTVADRLTENGEYSVLVIEYGLYHNQTGMHPDRMFDITSEPSPELGGRSFMVGIGCGVGGSSLVNGQVMLRGTKEEYDAWKELGGPDSDWDWEGLLPYFKKAHMLSPPAKNVSVEYNVRYSQDYWGDETPIYSSYGTKNPSGLTKDLYAAMAGIPGINIAEDSGSGENGLYWYGTSHIPGTSQRAYARSAHWDNVPRDNYEMVVGAKVDQIDFDYGMVATGVQFHSLNSTNSTTHSVKARREVILAAGAIHTPQVLMLSGVGPAHHLEEAGIDIKLDLPGVGSNFQDHSYIPSIGYRWGEDPPNSPGGGMTEAPNLVAMIGIPNLAPKDYKDLSARYANQDPESHLPNTYTEEQVDGYRQQQAVFSRLMQSPDTTFNEMMMFGPGGSIQNLHPVSRGTIRLNETNPDSEVVVDYRGASNPLDLEIMAHNIHFMRRYMASEKLAKYEPREFSPGPDYNSTAQLVEWVKEQIIPSVFHPVGSCAKVPREHGGCVDEQLRVYGTKKLSVIDASIMPTNVGATTQQTVYAIAEKAADIIKARTFG